MKLEAGADPGISNGGGGIHGEREPLLEVWAYIGGLGAFPPRGSGGKASV